MTLNEIMVSALQRLHYGSDTQTVETYRDAFADYANRAIRMIALRFKQNRKETVELSADGTFNVTSLARECLRITEVRAADSSVDYWQDVPGSGEFSCDTEAGSVDVIYRFVPKPLENTIDVPELPGHLHDMIVHYVVACERCGGDPDTQDTASADFSLFNTCLAKIQPASRGEPRSYKLNNY